MKKLFIAVMLVCLTLSIFSQNFKDDFAGISPNMSVDELIAL